MSSCDINCLWGQLSSGVSNQFTDLILAILLIAGGLASLWVVKRGTEFVFDALYDPKKDWERYCRSDKD